MKVAVLASFIGAASAFAPASLSASRSSMALNAEKSPALPFLPYPENLKGYAGEEAGFDPFRFSDFAPMDFLREAELKHCRMCMLAYVGYVGVDLGLAVLPAPEGLAGLTSVQAHDAAVEQGGMAQILLWISLAEIFSTVGVIQMLGGSGRKPGNFGFDPLNFCKGKSDEEVRKLEMNELRNGRLAMLAFSGVVTQSVLTQGPFPYV